MGVPPVKIGPHPFLFLTTAPKRFCMVGMRYFSGKFLGIDSALLPNREWNQRQKHKKHPFGDATDLAGEGGVGDVVWMIQACLKSGRPQR